MPSKACSRQVKTAIDGATLCVWPVPNLTGLSSGSAFENGLVFSLQCHLPFRGKLLYFVDFRETGSVFRLLLSCSRPRRLLDWLLDFIHTSLDMSGIAWNLASLGFRCVGGDCQPVHNWGISLLHRGGGVSKHIVRKIYQGRYIHFSYLAWLVAAMQHSPVVNAVRNSCCKTCT